MTSRLCLAALVAALFLAAGCRGGKTKSTPCVVDMVSVRDVGGSLEVAVSVRWTVAGKNYRMNKPRVIGRFDSGEHTAAELEKRFARGAEVECTIDPGRPTRVDLPDPS